MYKFYSLESTLLDDKEKNISLLVTTELLLHY